MSRNYDNWEKLVGAVLRREKDRQLALCESFSTSSSVDFSSRFSFDSSVEDVGVDYFSSSFSFNPFAAADVFVPAGVDEQIGQEVSINWDSAFWHLNDMKSVSRSSGPRVDPTDPSSQHILFFRDVMALDYEEIRKATKFFGSDTFLGEGGFGPVYKGWIHEHNLSAVKPGSGIAVAVKKLNLEGLQGHTEWLDETNYLSQLRHPNLVRLIGYSFDKDDRILVYEYMARGSLSNHLFTRGHPSLPWATRIKVALGVARALAFLHGLEVPVIHRNVKSGDILLDGDFNPKLSDFGLAIDGPTGDETYISTEVMGTYGYTAPEYVATGHLYVKSDVYGFGVVLLEMMTGLRALDGRRPLGQQILVDWLKPTLSQPRKVKTIMYERIEGQYSSKAAIEAAKLTLRCLEQEPRRRPSMEEVVVILNQISAMGPLQEKLDSVTTILLTTMFSSQQTYM